MDMRHARFQDVPALAAFDSAVSRAWVAEDDPAAAYLTEQRWRPTGRKRRIPHRPEFFFTEAMLDLTKPLT